MQCHRAVLLFLVLILPGLLKAQFVDQGLGAGLLLGGTVANVEQNNGEVDYYVRAFMRTGLFPHVQGELGLGSAGVASTDFRTVTFPIDLRLLLSPFSFDTWNPYIFAGMGFMPYHAWQRFPGEMEGNDRTGSIGYVPAGLGFQFLIDNNIAFELQGGYNYALTGNLNYTESDNKTDGFYHFALGLTWVGEGGNVDSDGDGLLNKEEKQLGTDPKKADTDGDGLGDGAEVKTHFTSPLKPDTDGDGLDDGVEVSALRTNPIKADTDGDGLGDGQEVNTHKTDPLKPDTDGDGLSDNEEVTVAKTSPTMADTDNDGLNDGAEVNTFKSDPLKPDTDGDTLLDGEEANTYRSNPLALDSDNDGLRDDEEARRYRTRPDVADSDAGSVADGIEVKRGTDPLNGKDDVMLQAEVGKAIALEGILFATGSAIIDPTSENALYKAYSTLKSNPDMTVQIQGHTDNTGSRAKNVSLSTSRANAVRDWLIARGIDGSRITTKGFGPDKPIAPNTSEPNRAKNRRIEFVRTK